MEASIPPKSAITSTVSNLKYSYQQTGKTQNKTKADCALSRRTRLKQEGGGAQGEGRGAKREPRTKLGERRCGRRDRRPETRPRDRGAFHKTKGQFHKIQPS